MSLPPSSPTPAPVRRGLWSRIVGNAWIQAMFRPSVYYSLGFLTLGGFVAGVIFWGAFNTALEYANTEQFCVGCHEMRDNTYMELKGTVHWDNRSGVRATCPDCHVPHPWTLKIARKMAASKEIWGKLFGLIDTREKFLAMRPTLAQHEWDRMEANKSAECRNCHKQESMNFDKQSPEAVNAHKTQLLTGQKSCIDCHKGIAHKLPAGQEIEGFD